MFPMQGGFAGSESSSPMSFARSTSTTSTPQIAFKPDWTKHAKAAPFKRNDAMLAVLPSDG
jgi:hypothetical protein